MLTSRAIKTLTTLADFLATEVKPKWFNLDYWAEEGWIEKKCGTTACAMGWATVCFPKSGLTLSTNDLHFKGQLNIAAAAKFCDIDRETACYLFFDSEYPESRRGVKAVVGRMRKLVKLGTRPPTSDETDDKTGDYIAKSTKVTVKSWKEFVANNPYYAEN